MGAVRTLVTFWLWMLVAAGLPTAQQAGQSASVQFSDIGSVQVRAIEQPASGRADLIISSSHGVVFSSQVGDPTLKPRLRFKVVDVPHSPSPLILAVAVQNVADGCRYDAIVVGETDQRLTTFPVMPALEAHAWGEGLFLGDLGGTRGFGLAVWRPVIGDDSVMDDHRVAVALYRYEATNHRFVPEGTLTSTKKYAAYGDALSELSLPYRDLAPPC